MLDSHLEQVVADLVGQELCAVVGLQPLDGEWDLVDDLLQAVALAAVRQE